MARKKNIPVPEVERGIEIPTRFSSSRSDKYHFSLLTQKGQSIFIPIGDENEQNLRQNLFQHSRRAKTQGKTLVIRKDVKNGEMGFRVWLTKIEKPK